MQSQEGMQRVSSALGSDVTFFKDFYPMLLSVIFPTFEESDL